MDIDFAERFTAEWLDAWNSHDLERILSHFTDSVVFTSPVAIKVLNESDGTLRGKAALRHYWSVGLERNPQLHFELASIYLGVDTLVINYRNQLGALVNEVLTFEGSLVRVGHGTYEVAPTT
ncbi:MAG: nuclear transport factor 2 family protein [Acidimicrobiales bacterium]